ncbi:hypothetical protein AB0L53_30505 [Nonomuraea sp. NPDC052129]|uniref:hypothetical protein n=1 Tax=Nonomuraea sp. NPDC052129 TaxID=3154651 RepID=UPI00343931E6
MTAAENIGLGDLPALGDAARLKEAAVRAGVHETLFELPRGYDTSHVVRAAAGPRTGH